MKNEIEGLRDKEIREQVEILRRKTELAAASNGE